MRERLIAAFVGVTVLLIVVFGVAGAFSVTQLLEDEEQRQVDRSVTLLAALVGERVQQGEGVTTSFLQRQLAEGENLEYVSAEGEVVDAIAAGYEPGGDAGTELQRTRSVVGGGAVTLSRSTAQVEKRVSDALLTIVLIGMLLVLLAAVLGLLAARRMSHPFQDLARLAGEFGRGRFDVEVPHYSIPEAEEIGRVIREAQRELSALVGRERAFAANASHQLKTPITALRLNLEDLTLWPQTPPDVAEELTRGVTELDRLSTTVSGLLELARDRRVGAAAEIDLCALVADTARRWRPRVEADGRRLLDQTPGEAAVRLSPGPLSQILDALILNAVTHGAGDISLTVAARDAYVRVQVSDQREAMTGDDDFRRTSAGSRRGDIDLSVAVEVAKAFGGYLRLEPEPPTTFSLMLPRSRRGQSKLE